MPKIFGSDLSRAELLRRVGSMAQIAGVRQYTYNSGYADGVKALEVATGPLRFEVLPSRCLDLSFATYKGIPLGYVSKSGIRHPAYFSKTDPTGSLDNFLGGVLTTCGLHNIGPASITNGIVGEQHGRIANIPAENVSFQELWEGDECYYRIAGEMHHSRFYGEDLVLRRTVATRLGSSTV